MGRHPHLRGLLGGSVGAGQRAGALPLPERVFVAFFCRMCICFACNGLIGVGRAVLGQTTANKHGCDRYFGADGADGQTDGNDHGGL
jgi:hypothetical protein